MVVKRASKCGWNLQHDSDENLPAERIVRILVVVENGLEDGDPITEAVER
jgi:hypothetical protein